jgi:ABC-type glutathione transport system ATPase component
MNRALLKVSDVCVEFRAGSLHNRVVHDVSFEVGAGEFVGIIGETGSGKSVTLRAALGMLPSVARMVAGTSLFEGKDLHAMGKRGLRELKGNRIGFIPQQPWSALNPVLTLEKHFMDIGQSHGKAPRWIRHAARDMLRRVEINDPDRVLAGYVGNLSGGMAQRAVIAMSLLLEPSLVVGDEPTTALDVTVQKEILELLARICREDGKSILMVTHDLGVVSNYCDRVYVMRDGRVQENGSAREIFGNPQHAYTQQLVAAATRYLPGSAQ